MNNPAYSLFLVIIISFLLSCSDVEKGKLIQGKWQCVSWEVNGDPNINSAHNVSFEFHGDKTFQYENNSLHEKGTYKVEGGLLYTTPQDQLEMSVEIEKLNQDTLIFNMSRGGTPEKMILVRMK